MGFACSAITLFYSGLPDPFELTPDQSEFLWGREFRISHLTFQISHLTSKTTYQHTLYFYATALINHKKYGHNGKSGQIKI